MFCRGVAFTIFCILLYGFLLANLPEPQVLDEEVAKEGGKLFTLKDGRKLEYFSDDLSLPGPVVVVVHGGLQTGWGLFTIKTTFIKENNGKPFKLITATIPGYGGSSTHNGRTLLSYGQDVAQLLQYLKVDKFYLAGMSWGGTHSLAILLSVPQGSVLGLALGSPAVPAMPDYEGWTTNAIDPVVRFMQGQVLAIPYLNRAVMRYLFRPLLSQEFNEDVFKQVLGNDPLGSLNELPREYRKILFQDFGRSVRYNVNGQPDLAELSKRKQVHIDFLEAGKRLGNTKVIIYYGLGDIVLHNSNFQYFHDNLVQGGAKNIQMIPSKDSTEGHLYCIPQVWNTISMLID